MTVVSSDKDLMQLVQPGLVMLDTMKNRTIGPDEVREKFGVPPDKVVDVQALAGDSTDNVPGVPGIGVKTAAELINEYGDLETLLARAGEIKQPKRRERLTEFALQARLSLDLVTLKDDVPITVPVEQFGVRDPEPESLLGFLREMEFSTLTKRIAEGLKVDAPPPVERSAASTTQEETSPARATTMPPKPGGKTPAPASGATPQAAVVLAANAAKAQKIDRSKYATVTELAQLEAWIAEAHAAGRFAFDTETTSLDAMQAEFVGFSLAVAPGRACYVPLGHRVGAGSFDFGDGDLKQVPISEALALLKPLLEDASILKIGQNLKYDCLVLRRHGIELAPLDDTMLLSYALDGGRGQHGMDALAERHLGHACLSFPQVLEHAPGAKKSDKTFAQVPLDKATEYAAEDADVTLRLWMALKPRLAAERMTTVYETLERPLVAVLGDMERAGVKVDKAILSRLTSTFAQRIARLEEEIYELAGHKFNLGSPKQLGEFLFDSLKLPGGRKTKTGQWETRANLLDDLAAREDLPEDARKLINVMLEWRQLAKLRSTYTDSLPAAHQPGDGPDPYLLRAGFDHNGASGLDRPEPAEYSNPHQGRPGDPHGFCRRARAQAHFRRLQPDRAARAGARCRDPAAQEGFRGGPRYSRHDGVRDVRRCHRGHAARGAPARQGHQFRHYLRHLGIRVGRPAQYPQAGGGRVHRHLFQALPRYSRLHGGNQETGARAGVCGDHFRPPRALPGNQYQEPVHARVSGARRHKCADPGLGRRYHPPGHDPHAAGIGGRALELGAHAIAGA